MRPGTADCGRHRPNDGSASPTAPDAHHVAALANERALDPTAPPSAANLLSRAQTFENARYAHADHVRELPAAAATWWADLNDHERQWLTDRHPDAIGSVDGLPLIARDAANRRILEAEIARVDTELQPRPTGWWRRRRRDELVAYRDTLHRIANTRDRTVDMPDATGQLAPHRQQTLLHTFRPHEAKVAVAYGPTWTDGPPPDPDQSSSITVLVPGTTYDLSRATSGMDRTETLDADLRAAAPEQASGHTTILWAAYETPKSLVQAMSPSFANVGSGHLVRTIQGTRAAARQASPPGVFTASDPDVTLIGHSYGARVAARAAEQRRTTVRRVLLVGPPGVGSDEDVERFRGGIDHGRVVSFYYGSDFLHREGTGVVQRAVRRFTSRTHGRTPREVARSGDGIYEIAPPAGRPVRRGLRGAIRQSFVDHGAYFTDPVARAKIAAEATGRRTGVPSAGQRTERLSA